MERVGSNPVLFCNSGVVPKELFPCRVFSGGTLASVGAPQVTHAASCPCFEPAL